MKIGIFETEHFEGSYPVIRLFDNGVNKIIIFTNEATFRQFRYLFANDLNRYEWIVQGANESKYHFIRRIYQITRQRKLDLLYLNTISNNFIIYAGMIALLRKTRIVVSLHAINNYFRFKTALSLRRWVRHIGKRALIKVTKEFNVVSDTMVSYLKNKLPAGRIVHNVPGAIFDPRQHQNQAPVIQNSICMVVPGSIDSRRRDYDTVLEFLKHGKHLPVKVILLGAFASSHGDEIKKKCIQYAATHDNLLFYDHNTVDQPEFDRVMNLAHIVFMPSVINTIMVDEISETYGVSICSGNIFDIIKHAKPFLVPRELIIPASLATSAITYNRVQDIIEYIGSLLQEPDRYPALLQQALRNSGEFTIEKVRARNPTLFALPG